MVIKKPSVNELTRIAQDYKLELTTEDITSFQGLMTGTLESYSRLDELTEPSLPPSKTLDITGHVRQI